MIKVGDDVVLNSGGPVMVVRSILPDGTLECTWDTQPGPTMHLHDYPAVCVYKIRRITGWRWLLAHLPRWATDAR
ncbi:MAG: hypothetical protein IH804_09825 [Planctomycetes bacterium]|nr:hypothetical protein [Planctomycetota bacterium]